MNTLDNILTRKSTRSYTGENITDDELALILKSAMAAPIAMRQYDLMHMTVVTNKDLLAKIEEITAEVMGKPDIHPLYNAPTLIVVSSKIDAGRENAMLSSAAIMIENMSLMATELGLGSCLIWGAIGAVANNDDIKKALDIPEGFSLCSAIIVGKTDETFEAREVACDKISVNIVK